MKASVSDNSLKEAVLNSGRGESGSADIRPYRIPTSSASVASIDRKEAFSVPSSIQGGYLVS